LVRGNAHAVMVTAVSPSSFDYEETISSLKYADRAKRVRMRVEANVTSGLLATDSSGDYDVLLLPKKSADLNVMQTDGVNLITAYEYFFYYISC
jgi:hypothetical protein